MWKVLGALRRFCVSQQGCPVGARTQPRGAISSFSGTNISRMRKGLHAGSWNKCLTPTPMPPFPSCLSHPCLTICCTDCPPFHSSVYTPCLTTVIVGQMQPCQWPNWVTATCCCCNVPTLTPRQVRGLDPFLLSRIALLGYTARTEMVDKIRPQTHYNAQTTKTEKTASLVASSLLSPLVRFSARLLCVLPCSLRPMLDKVAECAAPYPPSAFDTPPLWPSSAHSPNALHVPPTSTAPTSRI